MLAPAGQRVRHTLRKLPKARPISPAKTVPRMGSMRGFEYTRLETQAGRTTLAPRQAGRPVRNRHPSGRRLHCAMRIFRPMERFTLDAMDVERDADGSAPLSSTASGRPIATDAAGAGKLFEESAAIMARLRAPGGCPWDREQSFDTIRKYTLEEAYEVFDAIERRDFPHLAEELGDLMLQVIFYAEMAANGGHFTISDVLERLNRKLVRRHPHVFGEEASRAAGNRAAVDATVDGSSAAVLRNWEEIKAQEK